MYVFFFRYCWLTSTYLKSHTLQLHMEGITGPVRRQFIIRATHPTHLSHIAHPTRHHTGTRPNLPRLTGTHITYPHTRPNPRRNPITAYPHVPKITRSTFAWRITSTRLTKYNMPLNTITQL